MELSGPTGRAERVAAGVLILALAGALSYQAWRVGITVDEPAHVLSAYLYWLGQDNLEPRDLPPLIKIVGGWPARLLKPPLPVQVEEVWRTRSEWIISGEMLGMMSPRDVSRLFFFSRLPLIVFPLLITAIIWQWGRELFSPRIGLVLAAIFALEPTALSHGALFKNDLAATFALLWFCHRAWKLWKRPDAARTLALGAALGVAVLAKISLLILIAPAPIFAAIAFLRLPVKRWRALTASIGVLAVAYVIALAGSQFEVRLSTAKDTIAMPRALLPVAQLFRVIPVPKPVWDASVSLLKSNRDDTGWVYALGRTHPGGQAWYFPLAVGVKTPIALQLLAIAGAIATLARWRMYWRSLLFWAAPGLIYFALASMSNLQLGLRLVLPALPFAIFVCGPVFQSMRGKTASAFVAALIGWYALESARIYPNGIAYFNQWAGGPDGGLHYLADSNLDWGQSLGEVAAYCHREGIPRIRLAYWGWDRPLRYFRPEEVETLVAPWEKEYVDGTVFHPAPGYYAISSQFLPGYVFAPGFQDYFREFRESRPIARAGHSIYIYKIEQRSAAGSAAEPRTSGAASPE